MEGVNIKQETRNKNMINLHIIGDSHAREFTWGGINITGLNIICHYLIDKTCAAFGIERPSIYEMGVRKNDWVCFCFGEIDCRVHIGRNKEYYKEIIDKIVENYFFAINQYKIAKKFVFNVVPSNIQATASASPFPSTGTDEERRCYVRFFNECLKNRCGEFGFIYFDVYDKYADENGYFNLQYRDDCGHIANPIFLTEFLKMQT